MPPSVIVECGRVDAHADAANVPVRQSPGAEILVDHLRQRRYRVVGVLLDRDAVGGVAQHDRVRLRAVQQAQRHRCIRGMQQRALAFDHVPVRRIVVRRERLRCTREKVRDQRIHRDAAARNHDAGLARRAKRRGRCLLPAARASAPVPCTSCRARSRCRPSARAGRCACVRCRPGMQLADCARPPAARRISPRRAPVAAVMSVACAGHSPRRGRRLSAASRSSCQWSGSTPPVGATPTTIEPAPCRAASAGDRRGRSSVTFAAGCDHSPITSWPHQSRSPKAVLQSDFRTASPR